MCRMISPIKSIQPKSLRLQRESPENKIIKMCKVQWSHHLEDEATWEREDELKAEFPQLFSNPSESQGHDSI